MEFHELGVKGVGGLGWLSLLLIEFRARVRVTARVSR